MPLRDHLSDRGPSRRSPSDRVIGAPQVIVGALLLIIILAAVWLKAKSRGIIAVDQKTLCPINRPPSQVNVILVDASDRFGDVQRLEIQNVLTRLRDQIPKHGLVEVYKVDHLASNVISPVMHICNPGTGADLNELYENPALARKKWQQFAAALLDTINHQISGPPQATSPIFEAIQATAVRTFDSPQYDTIPKELVVVSDLLQNVPGQLDMYHELPSFEIFRERPYFSKVRADLANVRVSLLYLKRPVPTQGMAHIRFWEDYFRAQGAVVDNLNTIFGSP